VESGWPFGNRPTPRRMWMLYRAGYFAECEINPLGQELRSYECGAFVMGRVFETAALADASP
jgi:hypothetical protein